jgi:hypothetical protein
MADIFLRMNLIFPSMILITNNDALATSNPVKSMTMVWKLSKLSRRPWAISGWYGVYWVVLIIEKQFAFSRFLS